MMGFGDDARARKSARHAPFSAPRQAADAPEASRACIPVAGSMFSFSSSRAWRSTSPFPRFPPAGGAPPIGDPIVVVSTPHRRAMRIAAKVSGEVHFSAGGLVAPGVGATLAFTSVNMIGAFGVREARARECAMSHREYTPLPQGVLPNSWLPRVSAPCADFDFESTV